MKLAPSLVVAASSPLLASAFSWSFKGGQPTQCGNITIAASGGSPPYSVLVIPFGSSPLPNNIEARKIQSQSSDSADINFKLNFPANSQFVAVLSDSTGFASGGTSVGVLVTDSSDSSCFDASKNVAPQFVYSVVPDGAIVQCTSTRIWWDNSTVKGNPKFRGVIPGGQSFELPQNNISNVPEQGTGFSWKPSLRGGTTLLLVAGDDRGDGSGGSTIYTVGSGPSNDGSCLNDNSPSSTPGDPAGGAYATSTSGGTTGGGSGGGSGGGGGSNHETNVAAIAGGTVAGVVVLIVIGLIALFFMRRRRLRNEEKNKVRPDLLQTDDGDEAPAATRNELPQYYQPQPYLMAESTVGRSSMDERTDTDGRPLSTLMSDTASRSETPDPSSMSTSTRKTGPMRQMRPVNIIQHADAGPSVPPATTEEEPETVELPPAYTNIRK